VKGEFVALLLVLGLCLVAVVPFGEVFSGSAPLVAGEEF
jgi:hypothetical protein